MCCSIYTGRAAKCEMFIFFDGMHGFQKIIHVVNRFTRDHTIFTPLRAKRPVFPPDVLEAE